MEITRWDLITMNKGTPPKDDKTYLVDIGYPWLVMAVYNRVDDKWSYATLEVDIYDGEFEDTHWVNEQAKGHEILRWMDYPGINAE